MIDTYLDNEVEYFTKLTKKQMSKFDFLTAPRFWSMVVASAGVILLDPSFPSQPWYVSLGKFLALVGAGFTTVGTIDKYGDKQIIAAGVSNGSVETSDVVRIPPTE